MSLSTCNSNHPLFGVWIREWEEDPLECAEHLVDRTTLVYWTQSKQSSVYVDIRLPQNSPGRMDHRGAIMARPSALAANGFSKEAREILLSSSPNDNNNNNNYYLNLLLQTKSFAGVLVYAEGDTTDSKEALRKDKILYNLANPDNESDSPLIGLCTCFWRRDLDYQPPTVNLDIGVCVSEAQRRPNGSLLLRETGADGSYSEGWVRPLENEQGPFMALELQSEQGMDGARKGYWVRAGNTFAYVVGRPLTREVAIKLGCNMKSHLVQDNVGKTLKEAVKQLTNDETELLELLGSYVGLTGEIDADGQWIIQNSTHPELVGCRLVGPKHDALACSSLRISESVLNNDRQEMMVTQTIKLAEDGQVLIRTWKLLELEKCVLPASFS
jgi:hypothetical protein